MIIDLKKIKDEQEVAITHTYDSEEEQLEFDDCHYVQPVTFTGTALRQVYSLHVTGTLDSTCVVVCSRCLAEKQVTVHEPVDLYFDIARKHEIDITPEVREQLIFLHQQQYLCSPECKGICPMCGVNRNNSSCSCEGRDAELEAHTDTTFANLKKMLNDREKEK